ncbi:MAG: ATP-binding protein [Bdellovibrionota bacterium]
MGPAHSALYTTASKLVIELGAQESSIALKRTISKYVNVALLIIDEIGYLSF